jgi:hypothetical protein
MVDSIALSSWSIVILDAHENKETISELTLRFGIYYMHQLGYLY